MRLFMIDVINILQINEILMNYVLILDFLKNIIIIKTLSIQLFQISLTLLKINYLIYLIDLQTKIKGFIVKRIQEITEVISYIEKLIYEFKNIQVNELVDENLNQVFKENYVEEEPNIKIIFV